MQNGNYYWGPRKFTGNHETRGSQAASAWLQETSATHHAADPAPPCCHQVTKDSSRKIAAQSELPAWI